MVAHSNAPRGMEPEKKGLDICKRSELTRRYTEFSLTLIPPFQQIDLIHENPLCRLIGRTLAATQTCGKGCGIERPAQDSSHTCPFGLTMRRVGQDHDPHASRWIGRRFLTVRAMHETLDRLITEGLNEESILAHLPPDPIATGAELRLAAEYDTIPAARESVPAVRESAPAVRESAPPAEKNSLHPPIDFQLENMLEYLEQVLNLIATAKQPETICERFLRSVAGVLPFDEMTIYLREKADADWVITAWVDGAHANPTGLRPRTCHLEPSGLGASAIEQHKILIERAGKAEPFIGHFQGPGTLAIPFPLEFGELAGVWMAHQSDPARVAALSIDLVRFMRLLSEFLAARLQHLSLSGQEKHAGNAEEPAESFDRSEAGGGQETGQAEPLDRPAACEQPALPAWDRLKLQEVIRPEAARASRRGDGLALLSFLAVTAEQPSGLPVEDLTRHFTSVLRPYDKVGVNAEMANMWYVILSGVQDAAAQAIASRLLNVFESVIDGHGRMGEEGLRCKVGISVWGADANSLDQLVKNAAQAALQASGLGSDAIRFAAHLGKAVVGL